MSFKRKQLFGFTATIMSFIFAIAVLNGCGDKGHHKIVFEYATDTNNCPFPAWIYTDISRYYHCNAFDNYEGDTNPITPKGFEVAGLCTSVITNLSAPNVFEDVFNDNIIVDCSSGALTSFDFITYLPANPLHPHPPPPLRVSPATSNVLKNAKAGELISLKVACYVQGFKRDSREYQFQMPLVVGSGGYADVCISGGFFGVKYEF